jgi:hypothetical protein
MKNDNNAVRHFKVTVGGMCYEKSKLINMHIMHGKKDGVIGFASADGEHQITIKLSDVERFINLARKMIEMMEENNEPDNQK